MDEPVRKMDELGGVSKAELVEIAKQLAKVSFIGEYLEFPVHPNWYRDDPREAGKEEHSI